MAAYELASTGFSSIPILALALGPQASKALTGKRGAPCLQNVTLTLTHCTWQAIRGSRLSPLTVRSAEGWASV